ncbi:FmdE family protein [Desulforhopalus sp. 52FAK]
MKRTEVLRSIDLEQLDYIQQKIEVVCDNVHQLPVGFAFAGKMFPVNRILCRCKIAEDHLGHGYLVEVGVGNVFYLYNQTECYHSSELTDPSIWVLCFRVLKDQELMRLFLEDRKMLANIALKRVVDFHGHVCPELVLGSKFCEFVQHLPGENVLEDNNFSVLAENSTSALDAIQILLGVTVGNQRLMVMDYGKHNYTLYSRHKDTGWIFRLKAMNFGDEESFHWLEGKIINNSALLEDIVSFQKLIDERVRRILALSPEELFILEPTQCAQQQPQESTSLYTICAMCGQQVLATRCIERRDKILCQPCFQKEAPGCIHYGIQ